MIRAILLTSVLLALSGVAEAALEVWVESSLTNVLPGTEPGPRPRMSARLYAARGESESFQICIRGGRKGSTVEKVVAEALDESIGAPDLYRVGYLQIDQPSPRNSEMAALWPDPLLEMGRLDVPAKETRAIWVTYRVPREAAPGLHKGQITLEPAKGTKVKVPVTVQVYDFALPEAPALTVYGELDRAAIRRVYSIPDEPLEAWKPIYDALGKERLSFGLWNGAGLVRVKSDGSADTEVFKQHLEYAVEAAGMAAINVGRAPHGIEPWPEPPEGVVQDPLQLYLFEIDNWLADQGWLDRAFIQPLPAQVSKEWQEARKAYFRVWRADKRVHRMLRGALHPMLERYTDIWAVPTRYYQPFAQQRLQAGYSLKAEPAHPLAGITASSSGGEGEYSFARTEPAEACDGSLFTSWISEGAPTDERPEWIQFDLAERIQTSEFRIGWRPGLEPQEMRLKASFDGRVFSPVSVRWDHHFSLNPFDQSWSEGRFRTHKPFKSLWIEFRGTVGGGPVGITEIEFGEPPKAETVERIEPLRIWTYSLEGDFPSLYVDADPSEPRLAGWMCWGHGASGLIVAGLNAWPETWLAPAGETPEVWSGGGWGQGFLFYPGTGAPTPSVRVERIRDGIEDYGYIKRLDEAVRDERVEESAGVARWRSPRFFASDAPPKDVANFAERIEGARAEMGQVLSEAGEGKTE